jgi:hypothetical protein
VRFILCKYKRIITKKGDETGVFDFFYLILQADELPFCYCFTRSDTPGSFVFKDINTTK